MFCQKWKIYNWNSPRNWKIGKRLCNWWSHLGGVHIKAWINDLLIKLLAEFDFARRLIRWHVRASRRISESEKDVINRLAPLGDHFLITYQFITSWSIKPSKTNRRFEINKLSAHIWDPPKTNKAKMSIYSTLSFYLNIFQHFFLLSVHSVSVVFITIHV